MFIQNKSLVVQMLRIIGKKFRSYKKIENNRCK